VATQAGEAARVIAPLRATPRDLAEHLHDVGLERADVGLDLRQRSWRRSTVSSRIMQRAEGRRHSR
jgi:hypothetical protein